MRLSGRTKLAAGATLLLLVGWLALVVDGWTAQLVAPALVAAAMQALLLVAIAWAVAVRRWPAAPRALVLSLAYLVAWHWSVVTADYLAADTLRATLAYYGLGGLFLLGLGWVVWLVERASQRHEAHRAETAPVAARPRRLWNPFDPSAWYYGRKSRRLNQSLVVLASYSVLFLAGAMLVSQLQGCEEVYELPAGGGQQKVMAQTVRIQKIIKKKFVINPFSAIRFETPPIDVQLQLTELTQHAYQVGYGQGDGAGFAGGTWQGKVRFIRLEYSGGDWNQDFGVGADLNMLIQYNVRTSQKVHDQTESRTVAQLGAFAAGKSPPLVYMTGQKNISLSKSEIKTLREYLLDKHGMLFADNGGSSHFHSQFFSMMRQVLPSVEPVRVALDDVIHRNPYAIPFLPYVAPHGGKDAWGWKVDGRWVCYYHPGDIGDAWADGHSGVPREVWDACYQLGTNIIYYAHAEYAKWLAAQRNP